MQERSSISIKEFAELLWINLIVCIKNYFEYLNTIFSYYYNLKFAKSDISLFLMYMFHNPFGISKRFLMNKGIENVYAYGETPLSTIDHIAKECHITANDNFFELGCGRGRLCFWLNSFIKCKVIGVEFVPEFIERAKRIQNKLGFKNIEFRTENILDTNLTGATVIYLYGTGFSADLMKALTDRFKALPSGTKIITVSYPLSDYAEKSQYEVMKRFPCKFTWGEGDVYLQIKK
jgi:SAM-dependent methyltransferase